MSSSGKTSIIKKYLNEPLDVGNPKVNVKFSEKKKTVVVNDPEIPRDVQVDLQIWDPAGADAYSSMTN